MKTVDNEPFEEWYRHKRIERRALDTVSIYNSTSFLSIFRSSTPATIQSFDIDDLCGLPPPSTSVIFAEIVVLCGH